MAWSRSPWHQVTLWGAWITAEAPQDKLVTTQGLKGTHLGQGAAPVCSRCSPSHCPGKSLPSRRLDEVSLWQHAPLCGAALEGLEASPVLAVGCRSGRWGLSLGTEELGFLSPHPHYHLLGENELCHPLPTTFFIKKRNSRFFQATLLPVSGPPLLAGMLCQPWNSSP